MNIFKDINFIHFDIIDSTNNWAKANASKLDIKCLTCITASEQTEGRGRFSRRWISPKGNLYATLFFTLPAEVSYLKNLGQILAYACICVLKENSFGAQIKWPNDILIEKKKVSGVLSETLPLNDRIGVVLGIGINVNMDGESLKNIDQPATSLSLLSKKSWDLDALLKSLVHQFLQCFEILQEKGFAPFQSDFQQLLAYKGKEISCYDGSKMVKGICHAITKEGGLEILLPSGKFATLLAGEIEFS